MKKWKGIILTSALLGTIGFAGCGCQNEIPDIDLPTNIVVQNETEVQEVLGLGQTRDITYRIIPDGLKPEYDDVRITFDKTGIVEFADGGGSDRIEGFDTFTIKAIGEGTVTITVTTRHRALSASITIEVVDIETLATPSISCDGTKISWDAVNNAQGYIVRVAKGNETPRTYQVDANTNTYTLPEDFRQDGVQYTASVRAIGDGKKYLASPYSAGYTFSFLPLVSDFTIDGTKFVFEPVDGATSYSVTINNNEHDVTFNTTDTTFDLVEKAGVTADRYTVRILPQNESANVFQSHQASEGEFTVNKLATVSNITTSVDATTISFDAVTGAEKYTYLFTQQGRDTTITKTSTNPSLEISSLEEITAGQWTVKIYPSSHTMVDGDSTEYSFEKLGEAGECTISNNQLTIAEGNITASKYRLTFVDTITGEKTYYTSTNRTVDILAALDSKSGKYELYIALAGTDGEQQVTGNDSETALEFTILALPTVTKYTNNHNLSSDTYTHGHETITWSAVEGAVSYNVYIKNGSGFECIGSVTANDSEEYSFELNEKFNTLLAGEYGIYVSAVGDGTDYLSSKTLKNEEVADYKITKLNNVQAETATFDETTNKLTWAAVEGAAGYALSFDGGKTYYQTSENAYYVTQNLSETTSVTIIALGYDSIGSDTSNWSANSNSGSLYTIKKLQKISTVNTSGGKLTFTDPNTSDSIAGLRYVISNDSRILAEFRDVEAAEGVITLDLDALNLDGGTYTIKLSVRGTGCLDSDETEVTIKVLNTIGNSTVTYSNDDTYKLNWDSIEGVTSYSFEGYYLDNGGNKHIIPTDVVNGILGNDHKLDATKLASGTYKYRLRAMGGTITETEYISSKWSEEFTFVVFPKVSVKTEDNKLVWNASTVGNLSADQYDIYMANGTGDEYKKVGTVSEGLEFDLAKVTEASEAGTYKFYVVPYGTLTDTVKGANSDVLTLTKSDKLSEVTVKSGVLTWTDDVDGENVTYLIFEGDTLLGTTAEKSILDIFDAGKEYTVKVVRRTVGQMDSVASDEISFTRLVAPANFVVANNVITFDAVENATGYRVTDVGSSGTWQINVGDDGKVTFDLRQYGITGAHHLQFVALGSETANGANYLNSAPSVAVGCSVLANHISLAITDGKLTWTAESGDISGYELHIYTKTGSGDEYSETTTKIFDSNTRTYDFQGLAGEYYVKILAKGNNLEIFDSVLTNDYFHVTKLATPQITLNLGSIKLVKDNNISGCKFTLYRGGEVLTTLADSESSYFDSTAMTGNVYAYSLVLTKDGCVSSDVSKALRVQYLDIVTGLRLVEGDNMNVTLQWAPVEHANGYNVYRVLDNGIHQLVTTVESGVTSIDVDLLANSQGHIVIQAIGGNVGYSDITDGDEAQGYCNGQYSAEIELFILAQVTDLKLTNGVLTWTDAENATEYLVRVYKVEGDGPRQLVASAFVAGTEYRFETEVDGEYCAEVYTIGDYSQGTGYISNKNPKILDHVFKHNVLEMDTVKMKNGLFTFDVSVNELKDVLSVLPETNKLSNKELGQVAETIFARFSEGTELTGEIVISGVHINVKDASDALYHLFYLDVAYDKIANFGDITTSYEYSYGNLARSVSSTDAGITVTFDFLLGEGYYNMMFCTSGNSGDEESTYKLYLAGNMTDNIKVYKALTPTPVQHGELQHYIIDGDVHFNRVYYTEDNEQKESGYVVEVRYTLSGRRYTREHEVTQEELKEAAGIVKLDTLVNEFNLPTATTLQISVRVKGSTGEINTDEIIISRGSLDVTSETKILPTPSVSVRGGHAEWIASGEASYQLVKIYNERNEILDERQLVPVISEVLGVTPESAPTYITNGGFRVSKDMTQFMTTALGAGTNYNISVQECGNNVDLIDSKVSANITFNILEETVKDFRYEGGNIIFSGKNSAQVTVYRVDTEGNLVAFNPIVLNRSDATTSGQGDGFYTFTFTMPSTFETYDAEGNKIDYKIGVRDYPAGISGSNLVSTEHMLDKTFNRADTIDISSVTIDGQKLRWTGVDYATAYEVSVSGVNVGELTHVDDDNPLDTEIDLTEFPGGMYQVGIRATSSAQPVDSEKQLLLGQYAYVTITKYDAPEIRLKDGQLYWGVEDTMIAKNTSHVEVKDESGTVIYSKDLESATFDFATEMTNDDTVFDPGTYTVAVSILATPGTKDMTSPIEEIEVNYLGAPTVDTVRETLDNTPAVKVTVEQHASGYRFTCVTHTADDTESTMFLYDVYLTRTEELRVDRVAVTEYYYDIENEQFVLRADQYDLQDFNEKVYIGEDQCLYFYTKNVTLPVGGSDFEITVRAIGGEMEEVTYVSGKPAETIYITTPTQPKSVNVNAQTGMVTWTNDKQGFYSHIRYTIKQTLTNDYTIETLAKRFAKFENKTIYKLASDNHRVVYSADADNASEFTANTEVYIEIEEALDQNVQQFRLKTIGSYSNIYIFNMSSTGEISENSDIYSAEFRPFESGDGTTEYPYIIKTSDHMNRLNVFGTENYQYKVEAESLTIAMFTTISTFNGTIDFGTSKITYSASNAFIENLAGKVYSSDKSAEITISSNINYFIHSIAHGGNLSDIKFVLSSVNKTISSGTTGVSLITTNNGTISGLDISVGEMNYTIQNSGYVALLVGTNDGQVSDINIHAIENTGKIRVTTQAASYISAVAYRNGSNGTMRNIKVTLDIEVDETNNSISYVSTLATYNHGSITLAIVKSNLTSKHSSLSGGVNWNLGSLDQVSYQGKLTITESSNNSIYAVGLVGIMTDSLNIGGSSYQSNSVTVSNCYTIIESVNITSGRATVAGLIGSTNVKSTFKVENSYTIIASISTNGSLTVGLVTGNPNTNNNYTNVYYLAVNGYNATSGTTGITGASSTDAFTTQNGNAITLGDKFKSTKTQITFDEKTYYIYEFAEVTD